MFINVANLECNSDCNRCGGPCLACTVSNNFRNVVLAIIAAVPRLSVDLCDEYVHSDTIIKSTAFLRTL